MGAFASNDIENNNKVRMGAVQFVHQALDALLLICVIKVTTTTTIDHETWTKTIVVITYEPCPFSAK